MGPTLKARRAARKPDGLNEAAEKRPEPRRGPPSAYRGSDHVSARVWTTYRPVGIMSRELFTCP
ncbi:hypothetical protein GCM10010423_75220 [Streptomyces levis]|uniref:Uncharacterized protein n=1 Tax=Streptomyces levis TaxID=285566 RepID=A0ABP6BFU3_9ACTN